MNWNRLAVAALTAFVVLLLLNFAVYPLLSPDPAELYANARPSQHYLFTTLGWLATALLLAFIYPRGYQGRSPFMEGLRFGALLGLLMSLPQQLFVFAHTEIPAGDLSLSVGWTTASWAVTGVAIGLVYGRGTKTTRPSVDTSAEADWMSGGPEGGGESAAAETIDRSTGSSAEDPEALDPRD